MVSPFPVDALPVVSRHELGFLNALAAWLALKPVTAHADGGVAPGGPGTHPEFSRLQTLVGGAVVVRSVALGRFDDRFAGSCAVRIAGELVEVCGCHDAVRQLAQRLLGGPPELPAPRPLGIVEQAIWALAVAAAVEDLGIAGDVLACEAAPVIRDARDLVVSVELAGHEATIGLRVPRALELRVPPAQHRRWTSTALVEVPVVVGRCALEASAVSALAVRSLITLEPAGSGSALGTTGRHSAELVVFGGAVGIAGEPGALVAEVTTGYVPRAMALPDDAHVELTVGLGTTQLSLRQVFELAIGQVVRLGRPLAGPFELRAAGKRVGSGELVNIDGELGVRIVSLEE